MPPLDNQGETLELINKEIADRMSRLATAGSQTDTKAALLGGVAATATQFLASRQNPQPELAVAAFIMFGLAFLSAVAAYAIVRHHDVPDPRDLVVGFVHLTKEETLASLIATRVQVFEANHRRHRQKVIMWWCSVTALGIGVILSAAAIMHTVPCDRACEQHSTTCAQQPAPRRAGKPRADANGGRLPDYVLSPWLNQHRNKKCWRGVRDSG
jgi:hypothetical protein